MPAAPRPSCVRCVITSSRLYTTPSVTLRRHKAAAASSSSSARTLNYEYADGVDYRGLTALTSLSMAVSGSAELQMLLLGAIFIVAALLAFGSVVQITGKLRHGFNSPSVHRRC
ncbi:hypothetical protein [Candidatus Reidiella endopervernicosa]|uniref:Uncharacterized protein n=1 Tax=Candidatus Reidiella endopervernicosa TaxID=2738883 RepID=A0A6N0HRQ5_9GAMM|nr:hypothetical protein [Candidatus Reidiella endopervernicosa]QKQ25112.1 hypothetical protein HUE57_01540 [Candidatus Reidiella endopervernicosa]